MSLAGSESKSVWCNSAKPPLSLSVTPRKGGSRRTWLGVCGVHDAHEQAEREEHERAQRPCAMSRIEKPHRALSLPVLPLPLSLSLWMFDAQSLDAPRRTHAFHFLTLTRAIIA